MLMGRRSDQDSEAPHRLVLVQLIAFVSLQEMLTMISSKKGPIPRVFSPRLLSTVHAHTRSEASRDCLQLLMISNGLAVS